MRRVLIALTFLLATASSAHAVKITLFMDTDTFVKRAQDIVIAKCPGPVPDGESFHDGLYPVDVQIISVIKGNQKSGNAKVSTIYTMEAGKTYMLTSLGGSAGSLSAVPELSVVELPAKFRLDNLKGKNVTQQVQAVFTARQQECERQQRLLEEEQKLLKKAVSN